jgi:hypothetical protein
MKLLFSREMRSGCGSSHFLSLVKMILIRIIELISNPAKDHPGVACDKIQAKAAL